MAREHLTQDPDWSVVSRLTFVYILPSGEVALRRDRSLPSDILQEHEHPLDACLRIPLEQAGFRYQHFHPFSLEGGHLIGWVEGDHRPSSAVPLVIGVPEGRREAELVAEALRDHERLPLETYFRESVRTLERAYLLADTPQGQSGFSGTEAAWRAHRVQVADGIDRDGNFLDVGCANGFLGESVARWCEERGLRIEPYGVDLAPRLIDLARRRLPEWSERFWIGNALDWEHPHGMRFDFVHLLLDAVPRTRRADLIHHHLEATVASGGRLLVSDYATSEPRVDVALAALGFTADGWFPSHDVARPSAGTASINKA